MNVKVSQGQELCKAKIKVKVTDMITFMEIIKLKSRYIMSGMRGQGLVDINVCYRVRFKLNLKA